MAVTNNPDSNTMKAICVAGVVQFAALLLAALWRSIVLVKRTGGVLPLTARKLFHLCIVVLSVFKLSEYAWMSRRNRLLENSVSRGGRAIYALHLLSYVLQLCALSIVVTLWAGALRLERGQRPVAGGGNSSGAGPTRTAPIGQETTVALLLSRARACLHNSRAVLRTLIVLDAAVLGYTVAVIVLIAREPDGRAIVDIAAANAWYSAFGWVAGLALFMTSCSILFYGLSISARITQRSLTDPYYYTAKLRRMVWRLNTSMAICCSAFAIRCGLLLFFSIEGEAYATNHFTELEWYLLLDWIPTIVPSAVLLFLMRRPDSNARRAAPQRQVVASPPRGPWEQPPAGMRAPLMDQQSTSSFD